MMFQIPATEIVKLQAEVTDTNYLEFDITGEENIEIEELKENIVKHKASERVLCGLDAILTGALRSDYQKSRIERMCHDLEVISYSPLWHNNPKDHMYELVKSGFEVMISSVSCEGLNEEWIGRVFDEESLEELSRLSNENRFNIDGEGGEYETSVVNAPHFSSRIFLEGEKIWKSGRGYLKIKTLKIEN